MVERYLPFIQRLQVSGVEIAILGYHHVDLKTYPPEEARYQLTRAVELFRRSGLAAHGFRCPYLKRSPLWVCQLAGEFLYKYAG